MSPGMTWTGSENGAKPRITLLLLATTALPAASCGVIVRSKLDPQAQMYMTSFRFTPKQATSASYAATKGF